MKQNWVKFTIPSPKTAMELSRMPLEIKSIFLEVYIYSLNIDGVYLEYYPEIETHIDKLKEWFRIDYGTSSSDKAVIRNKHYDEAQTEYDRKSEINRGNIQKRYESKKEKTTTRIPVERNRIEENRIEENRIEENREEEFQKFYEAYGSAKNRNSKKEAFEKWKSLIKQKKLPSLEFLLQKAGEYNASLNPLKNNEFKQGIQVWLNQERWNDDFEVYRPPQPQLSEAAKGRLALVAFNKQIEGNKNNENNTRCDNKSDTRWDFPRLNSSHGYGHG